MTEAVIGGIGALAMRRAGSVSEWNFAGLNEISSGYRTGLGACTPPTGKEIQAGDALMLDFHAMFQLALGDHSHNYLIAPATPRQRWHADNFVALVQAVLANYRAGATPSTLAQMVDLAESRDRAVLSCRVSTASACSATNGGSARRTRAVPVLDGSRPCVSGRQVGSAPCGALSAEGIGPVNPC